MRVIHVLGSYPLPPLGGIETVVVSLSESLARLGVENEVVATAKVPLSENGPGGHYLGLRAGIVSTWIQVPTPASLHQLETVVRRADIVHVHNPPESFNLAAIACALRLGRPLVLSLLSPGQLRHHPRAFMRWTGSLVEPLLIYLSKRASAVQVKNVADLDYVHRWRSDCLFIPDGIGEAMLRSPKGGSAPPPVPSDHHPLVLFLGRLNPLKGPEDLVEALPALVKRHPDLLTVFAGPDFDGTANRVRQLAVRLGVANHIQLLGPVTEADKLALLDCADVVALPSKANFVEGFSIVASEAWARNKPVAAYPVGALRVRVKDGVNGALARTVQPASLADAIERSLQLRELERPSDVVGWPEVAQQFLRVYERISLAAAR